MICDVPNCITHLDKPERRQDCPGVNRFLFRHEHSKLWRSRAGVTICGVCHPPPTVEMVEERIR